MSDTHRLLGDLPNDSPNAIYVNNNHAAFEDVDGDSATSQLRRPPSRLDMSDAVRCIYLCLRLGLLIYLAMLFYKPPTDSLQNKLVFPYSKIEMWTLVWLTVTSMGDLTVVFSTVLYKSGCSNLRYYRLSRLVRNFRAIFIFVWFVYGSKLLWFNRVEQSVALNWARIFWLLEASLFLIPCVLLTGFCLCLPCIVFLMVRLQVPPAEQRPTPPHIISRISVLQFGNHVRTLQDMFTNGAFDVNSSSVIRMNDNTITHTDTSSPSPHPVTIRVDSEEHKGSTMFTQIIEGTSAALGLQPQASSNTPPIALTENIQKSCLICFAEFTASDKIMVLPCDSRHYFHESCTLEWLKQSQTCPICRANLVTLLSDTDTASTVEELL